MNLYVNLIVQNVFQIIGGIMINVDVSVKNIIYVKHISFGILLHLVAKMEKKLASIMNDSAITGDEIIEAEIVRQRNKNSFNKF